VRERQIEKLHAKTGQLTIERDLYEGFEVKHFVFLCSAEGSRFSVPA
jgi:hypothetical protein